MAAKVSLTPQELYNNYEYKVSVKALIREYDWIMDIRLEEDKLNDYNLIFIDAIYNPYLVKEQYKWDLQRWVERDIEEGNEYESPYLSTAFKCPFEVAREVTDEIEETLRGIHKSPALPEDLKLPSERRLSIGRWVVPANFKDHHGIPEPNPEDIT
jgi:hypothetical protein